ncbi:hypothetical protein N665_0241s0054 [Sinapis alba]|nr:hypothetical protein N665_0241s0054 [Sinapis alba]
MWRVLSGRAESSSSSKPRLRKSKTERQQKVTHILAEDVAKKFHDIVSVGKKTKECYITLQFNSLQSWTALFKLGERKLVLGAPTKSHITCEDHDK